MTNLLALCRKSDGSLEVKRVSLVREVQDKIAGLFQGQASTFMEDVTDEVPFEGGWKPDENEILILENLEEVETVEAAAQQDALTLDCISSTNFPDDNIKALFILVDVGGKKRVLLQKFTAHQLLIRRFSLWLDGESFKELTSPAFSLDTGLVAIIEDSKLKFKSFFAVKRIFSLGEIYQEATDPEIDAFCAHGSLYVLDAEDFKKKSDQTVRKLVHAITGLKILENYAVTDIVEKASSIGFKIAVTGDGKIVMPVNRKDIKNLLRFLDDGIYQAPLSANRYITNSKRPLDA